MMRVRLRPTPSAEELASMYSAVYDHSRWSDNLFRVAVTAALAAPVMPSGGVVADLSCGDGAIPRRIADQCQGRAILGDLVAGYDHTGPIEETVHSLAGPVDMFVCSETIEHVDNPQAVLAAVRPVTRRLLLSTPDGETSTANPEHVWGWDAEAVDDMLRTAGFKPELHTTLDCRPAGGTYAFQIWLCS